MTVTDIRTREVVGEGSSLTDPGPEDTAEARAHAREGTSPGLAGEVGRRDDFAMWLTARKAEIAALLDKPGTLLHAQPPTFRQAHDRHWECARHYGHPVLRGSRKAYGATHNVTVKPVLNYLEWATASPLALIIHVLLGLAIWLGLRLGGYL